MATFVTRTIRHIALALTIYSGAAPASGADLAGAATLFQWGGSEDSDEERKPKRDEPLASDRPDFTEASSTVGAGLTQIEMGYTFIHDHDNATDTQQHSFPEALFRIGMFADWFEWRIAYNHGSQGVTVGGAPFTTDAGAEDLYVGVKLALTEQDGILPEMALIPQMTLPVGHETFTAHEVCPGVNWLYGWDVVEFLSTAGSTQINKSVDEDGSIYYEIAQSWTIGYTFTEHWGGYTEVFALFPSGASTALPEYYFDGGFIFPITNDLQFDVRAGVGLNQPADDYFLGTGVVVRF
jgi:hypothetical protein